MILRILSYRKVVMQDFFWLHLSFLLVEETIQSEQTALLGCGVVSRSPHIGFNFNFLLFIIYSRHNVTRSPPYWAVEHLSAQTVD